MTEAVTIAPPSSPVPQHLERTPVQAIYERAVRDPSIDLDRLERICDRLEAEKAQQREQAFYTSLNEAQKRMQKVVANKANSQTHSRYASYDALDGAVKPIYTGHGFGLTYDTEISSKGIDYLRVIAVLTHNSGYKRQYTIDMPIVTKGPKGNDVMTPIHATGSAFQYGKRYLLQGIFNIAISNDPTDDDGNAAGGHGPITADQVVELENLIKASDTKLAQFLAFGKVEALADIPAAKFASAKSLLEQKIAANKKKAEAKAEAEKKS